MLPEVIASYAIVPNVVPTIVSRKSGAPLRKS